MDEAHVLTVSIDVSIGMKVTALHRRRRHEAPEVGHTALVSTLGYAHEQCGASLLKGSAPR